jgi:hypothetical protein
MTSDQRDALEMELRTLAGVRDPVPADVTNAALAAFEIRSLDAELAELTYDSALDEPTLAGVRGSGGTRHITFEGFGVVLDLQVEVAGERRLAGQITPSGANEMELQHGGGTIRAPVDPLGHFAVSPAPHGPFSIRIPRQGQGKSLATMWIAI